jgi:hypothetical protein
MARVRIADNESKKIADKDNLPKLKPEKIAETKK